jgi:hypothetical protein
MRREWIDYIRSNHAGRVPEGVEEGLQRMQLTAYLAGDEGRDAAVYGLIGAPQAPQTPQNPLRRRR